MAKCLTKPCTKEQANVAVFKGLCLKCYSSAKKLVDSGQATWDELATMGLAIVEPDDFTKDFLSRKGAQ